MADPLSIVAGVIGVLTACVQVGTVLKDFYDGSAIADTKVKGLLTDVESFHQVLKLMKDTLEQEQIQSSLQATGHIGNHWTNLSACLRDGQDTLMQLQEKLEKINKSVSVLDGPRKHLRLKGATEEIGVFQQRIRSYRDTMQLSLQTVILYNQVSFNESTEKILPNLDELHQVIRRMAFDINDRMTALQNAIDSNANSNTTSNSDENQIRTLTNLRNCVQSAASVVSSASTTLGIEHADQFSVTYGSEFGDVFPAEPRETILRWISSNIVYEFEGEHESDPKPRRLGRSGSLELVEKGSGPEQSDSDDDLEMEIIQAMIKRGNEKFEAEDYGGAEKLFRNCLARTSLGGLLVSLHRIPKSKSEIMQLFIGTYIAQEKWDEAHSLLLEKIALGSHDKSGERDGVLAEMLTLVDVLLKKNSHAEALLYGRRALKGYRKLGSKGTRGVEISLRSLVSVCRADGNLADEEEAYAAMLSEFLQKGVQSGVLDSSAPLIAARSIQQQSNYTPAKNAISEPTESPAKSPEVIDAIDLPSFAESLNSAGGRQDPESGSHVRETAIDETGNPASGAGRDMRKLQDSLGGLLKSRVSDELSTPALDPSSSLPQTRDDHSSISMPFITGEQSHSDNGSSFADDETAQFDKTLPVSSPSKPISASSSLELEKLEKVPDSQETIDGKIRSFLGLGLARSEWPTEAKKRGLIPSSNKVNIVLYFVPDSGGEMLPFPCYRDTETEGNYIRQIVYDRINNKYKLQKDSDGMLNLSFSNKTKTKIYDGRFSVVSDREAVEDVVFGRERVTYASSQNISRYPKWEEKSLSRKIKPEEWKEYEDMQRFSSKGFPPLDEMDGSSDTSTPPKKDPSSTPPVIAPSHSRAMEGLSYFPPRMDLLREAFGLTAAPQRENPSSLRSLISPSYFDPHEMEEDILRQITEEGLLNGVDLDNIEADQENQLSGRIAEAYRQRRGEMRRQGIPILADSSSRTNSLVDQNKTGETPYQASGTVDSASRIQKANPETSGRIFPRNPKLTPKTSASDIDKRPVSRKLVIVGDAAVGKTSLVIKLATGAFPETHIPTVFDSYSTILETQGQKVSLQVWDTAGSEDYDRLRPLSFPQTDVFMICFAIDEAGSLKNVKAKWHPEIQRHGFPGTPFLVVGLKADLRTASGAGLVMREQAQKMALKLGAAGYFECSSLSNVGFREVFEAVTRLSLFEYVPKKKRFGGGFTRRLLGR